MNSPRSDSPPALGGTPFHTNRDGTAQHGLWTAALARPRLALAVLALAIGLAGLFNTPPLDRDEARYAQATAQMLETGDFVEIRFHTVARNKKPAGVHWLQAASTAAFSSAEARAIWSYRVPSVLGYVLAILLTFELGRMFGGRETGFAAGAILATSVVAAAEAHIAKTDAVLLATATATLLAMAKLYKDAREGATPSASVAYGFWLALAAGVLIKGPVVPAIALLALSCLALSDRDARWMARLRPISGLTLALLVAAPWFVLIGFETDGQFYREALGRDFAGKLASGQESHGGPPGYHTLLSMLTFWPGVMFLPLGLWIAWKARKATWARLMLAWAVPFWLACEAAPTKLPHYTLPVFPALAVIAAMALTAHTSRKLRLWTAIPAAIGTLALAATPLVATLLYAPDDPVAYGLGGAIGAAALALFVIAASRWIRRGDQASLPPLVVAAAALFLVTFQVLAPRVDTIWVSRDAAAMVAAETAPRPVVLAGYHEPSLIFILGTPTVLANDGAAAAEALVQGRAASALVAERMKADFDDALGAAGLSASILDSLSGLNYSRGDPVTLHLIQPVETLAP